MSKYSGVDYDYRRVWIEERLRFLVGACAIANDPERVEDLGERLSSISCFMGKLNEYISLRANKEEGITGRFWEGRFKSSRLSDAAAIVTCMAYVDLNPVRAKLAQSLQDSEYTSALME